MASVRRRRPTTRVAIAIVACLLCGAVAPAQQRSAPMTLDEAIQLLRAALAARAAPVVFDVPAERIKWDMTLSRFNQDTFFITYRPESRPEFRMQLTLCSRSGKTQWIDATLLGPAESAEVFSRDNASYLILVPDVDYAECLERYMLVRIGSSANNRNLYTSDDRLLKHMSNWVAALAAARDAARAGDFVSVLVTGQRDVLKAADEARDFERVAHRLELFDRWFPFTVLDQSDVVGAADRKRLADWLTTTIAARRKLIALQPELGRNLARDEALLRRLAADTRLQ